MADPTITAGEILVKGQIIYRHTDGKAYKATSVNPPLGIVKIGAAANATATLYPAGNIDCDTHSWASAGLNVYISGTAGVLTTTAPTAGVNDPVIVGRTAGTTTMFWYGPQGAGKGLMGFYHGGTLVGHRGNLNLVAGTNVTIAPVDSGDSNWAAYSISASPSVSGGPFISVKDSPYNAVGNGSNDDTAEIQAAINAVSAAGGGVVWFPKGTYRITGNLVAASNVYFLGAGNSVSKIYAEHTGADTQIFTIYDKSKVTIDSLGLFSTLSAATATRYAIRIMRSNDIVVKNCEIYHVSYQGIIVSTDTTASNRIWITDNYIHDIQSAETGSGADWGVGGIGFGNVNNMIITGNRIKSINQGDRGAAIYQWASNSSDTIIANNQAEDSSSLIQIQPLGEGYAIDRVVISGNTLKTRAGAQCHAITGAAVVTNIVVTGNTIYTASSTGSAVWVIDWNHYTFANNIIHHAAGASVNNGLVFIGGRNGVISGNVLIGNGAADYTPGLCIGYYSCDNLVVTGNFIRGCHYGIQIKDGSSPTIADIDVRGNTIYGVSDGTGIKVEKGSRFMISENKISNTSYGVHVVATTDYTLIKNNLYKSVAVAVLDSGGGHVTNTGGVEW